MSTRVQVILEAQERELFRWHAQKEGRSLSAWMRRAAQERVTAQKPKRITTVDQLREFFADCDNLANSGREPDWDEHLEVLQKSRKRGMEPR